MQPGVAPLRVQDPQGILRETAQNGDTRSLRTQILRLEEQMEALDDSESWQGLSMYIEEVLQQMSPEDRRREVSRPRRDRFAV